jgi:membrane protease YdiL (CAAX protease family)
MVQRRARMPRSTHENPPRTIDSVSDLASAAPGRRRIGVEIAIVLGLSFGASAVYALVAIANRLTLDRPLSQQTATLNPSQSPRPVFDLIYQFLGIVFDLVPVALVCYLLWQSARPHLGRLGLDGRRIGRDSLWGVVLVLVIGIPGLALYLTGRALGLAPTVVATGLDEHWWTAPVLALSALRSGVTEEVIVVGYLFSRMRDLRFGSWTIILSAAVLRGAYHLYQGVPAFFGNIAMGVLFGWLYARYGRLLPLIVAHTLIDVVVFLGYPFAVAVLPGLFAPPAS